MAAKKTAKRRPSSKKTAGQNPRAIAFECATGRPPTTAELRKYSAKLTAQLKGISGASGTGTKKRPAKRKNPAKAKTPNVWAIKTPRGVLIALVSGASSSYAARKHVANETRRDVDELVATRPTKTEIVYAVK